MNNTGTIAYQRLAAMDVLRGIALLGILLMNIQSFAMPGAAYLNPTAYGDLNGINFAVWSFSHVFADQKFMTLFSILFGAGVVLFCEHAQAKGKPVASLHYRRTFWLMLFGLAHAYLLWYGDILFSYAICGFIIYLLRNKSITTLLVTGTVLLLISTAYSLLVGASLGHFPPEAVSGMREAWAPTAAQISSEINAYLGSYSEAFAKRAEEALFMQTYVFLTIFVWRASAMMLLGMALYKSGFFHLKWQTSSYQKLLFVCLPLGLAITLFGVQQNLAQEFALEYSMFIGNQFNYWGSILVALGYAAAILLFVQSGRWQSLQAKFAAIGKTAFSNYILQTLICTGIFYGFGLGLFGEVERWAQLIIVFVVWLLQLWLAQWWLQKYQYGPLEWAWRSLTYWQRQPFRK